MGVIEEQDRALEDASKTITSLESKLTWADNRAAETEKARIQAVEDTEKRVKDACDNAIASLKTGFQTRFAMSQEDTWRQALVVKRAGFLKGYEHRRVMCNLVRPYLQTIVVAHTRLEWKRWQVKDGPDPPAS